LPARPFAAKQANYSFLLKIKKIVAIDCNGKIIVVYSLIPNIVKVYSNAFIVAFSIL
jgi:hypothetical protein